MARIVIGNILFDSTANEAIREDRRLRLEDKVMQILLLLARNANQTVTNEEILTEVWPEIVVTRDSISQGISKLRHLFNDDPKQPRVIETIPKKGYRLIAPVQFVDTVIEPAQVGAGPLDSQQTEPAVRRRHPGRTAAILAGIVFVVSSLISYGLGLGWSLGLGIVIGMTTLAYIIAYAGSLWYPGMACCEPRSLYLSGS